MTYIHDLCMACICKQETIHIPAACVDAGHNHTLILFACSNGKNISWLGLKKMMQKDCESSLFIACMVLINL